MDIAQISATFPPYMAGTGNVCFNYALELADLGHTVTVYTCQYPDVDYSYPGTIAVQRIKPVFRIGNAPFIPELLHLQHYDLVHLHYPFIFGDEMVRSACKNHDMPFVITYHNDLAAPGVKGLLLRAYQKCIAPRVLAHAHKIFVMSDIYARHSAMKDVFSAVQDKLVVLPNGVDTRRYHPDGDARNAPLQMLFAAALDSAHAYKGLDRLFAACAKLSKKQVDFRLLVIGDGDLREYYRTMARDLGIADNVTFQGNVDQKDMPGFYRQSALFVLPSLRENFPLVILEAMSSGIPVIAMDLPGLRTIVDHGRNGLLVPPDDVDALCASIDYLLHDGEARKRFGDNGRRKVEERFSWSVIVRRFLEQCAEDAR